MGTKKIVFFLLAFVFSLPLFADKWDNKTSGLEGKKILVFTKNGKGYVHDNIQASVEMFMELGRRNNMNVDTTSSSTIFRKKDLFYYDAIVFSNTNSSVFDTQDKREGFMKFIQSGRGFLGIHSAVCTEPEWTWFKQMIGGTFDFHPPFQKFSVYPLDKSHPCTETVPEQWKVEDELYILKEMNPNIRVLMVADFSSPDFHSPTPLPGTFGQQFPCVWSNDFDGGRQWVTTLGHDKKEYADSTFIAHIKGGLKWALTRERLYILAIGNSFSHDAVENHLFDLAQAEGVELYIGNASIGGCSLETHWENASNDYNRYGYHTQSRWGTKSKKETRLQEAIEDNVWDIITVQQVSQNSGMIDTYFPYLPNLIKYVKKHSANPNPTIAFHLTWAYETKSSHPGFATYNNNQMTMYNAILQTVEEATEKVGINLIIPSGIAIQNARKKLPSSQFCRDGFHLSFGIGRYTAACTWFETLTGIPVIGNKYRPENVSEEEVVSIQKTVHEIVSFKPIK